MKTHGVRFIAILLAVPMLAPAAWSQGKHQTVSSNSGSPRVVIVFTTEERNIISDWFWTNRNGLPPGLAKRDSLPPGLQKQLRRDGTLPPGLQKKLTPLPYALDSRLERLPSDYIRVVIGRDVILMDRRNNTVLDIISHVIRDPGSNDRPRYGRDEDDDDQGVYASRRPAPVPAPATSRRTVLASASSPTVQGRFNLKVRMTHALSTETTQTGARFFATLEEPVYEGNKLVARKGARAEGEVVESDKGGRVKGVASLSVKLLRFQLASGRYVELTSDPVVVDANATKAKDATKIAATTAIGAGVGAIVGGGKGAAVGAATGAGAGTGVVLATRGDPAVIPSESVLEFSVQPY